VAGDRERAVREREREEEEVPKRWIFHDLSAGGTPTCTYRPLGSRYVSVDGREALIGPQVAYPPSNGRLDTTFTIFPKQMLHLQ
jgi:hypothetical protein